MIYAILLSFFCLYLFIHFFSFFFFNDTATTEIYTLSLHDALPISTGHAVLFAWLVGGILVSYEALAEAAKYSVPSVASWIAVEVAVGFVQFTLYGALLSWVHRARVPQAAR